MVFHRKVITDIIKANTFDHAITGFYVFVSDMILYIIIGTIFIKPLNAISYQRHDRYLLLIFCIVGTFP